MPDRRPLPLLNVFEVTETEDGTTRHLLAFIEADRAGAVGIDPRSIVGEVTPDRLRRLRPAEPQAQPRVHRGLRRLHERGPVAVTPEIVEQARTAPLGLGLRHRPQELDDARARTRPRPTSSAPSPSTTPARSSPGRSSTTPEPRPDRPGAGHVRPLLRPAVLRLAPSRRRAGDEPILDRPTAPTQTDSPASQPVLQAAWKL